MVRACSAMLQLSLFLAVHILSVCIALVVLLVTAAGGQTSATISIPPQFLPALTYDSGGRFAWSVAVGDLNRDGKSDLVVANLSGLIGVLLGNGDGTFQPATTLGSYGAFSVVVADLNSDGKLDIATTKLADVAGTLEVLLGNGDGSFQPATAYRTGGAYASSIAVADVNGDNKPDLVVSNERGQLFGGLVGVLLGNGDGTFQPATTFQSGGGDAWSIAIADMNLDRKPDLIVANMCDTATCSNNGVVGVLLGNGDGTFQPSVAHDSGGLQAFSVVVGDVNADGKPDLATVNAGSHNIGVVLGNGDGTLQAATAYPSGGIVLNGAQSATLTDVNGDSRLDLLVANCGSGTQENCSGLTRGIVGVLPGNGDGTFQPAVAYDSGGFSATAVQVADVNGDRKPDMIVVNDCGDSNCNLGSVSVLLNNTATDRTPPTIVVTVSPKILWPANGSMVPVTVSGKITDYESGLATTSIEYAVSDEYQEIQSRGHLITDAHGNYSLKLMLRASRKGDDRNGRRYLLRVSASDNAGNRGASWQELRVPHDWH
jgi:VCBS repeat protein